MRWILGALLCAICIYAVASTTLISSHNEVHAGIQKSIDLYHEKGCIDYAITRSGRYDLVEITTEDPKATYYEMGGLTYTIKCVEWMPPPAAPIISGGSTTAPFNGATIELTWSTPAQREDGSTLELKNIYGYEILHNGVTTYLVTPPVNSYIINVNEPGMHRFSIRTIDSDMQYGKWSPEIEVPVEL